MNSVSRTKMYIATDKERKFKIKDPGSAITHGIALLLCIAGIPPLLSKAAEQPNIINFIALSVYIFTMTFLYFASTTYHSIDSTQTINRRLRKMDHMMIFIMIAGGYTPVCLIAMHNTTGYILCGIVWVIAILGIILKALWITCPKWVSSVLYIGLGCLFFIKSDLVFNTLPSAGLKWFIAGGVCYIVGGIIYAFKFPVFNKLHKNFGSHEIFHIFIMIGSIFQYVFMYRYLAAI